MVSVPLGRSDWVRTVSDEAQINVVNRFFEQNPTNLEDQVSLLSRPGMKRFLTVGAGPIRAMYSQPGSFDDCLFVVSDDSLYRVDGEEVTFIGAGVEGVEAGATPYMAATASLGSTPAYLFLADGRNLWLYVEDGYALGTLTATGAIASGDKILIGTTYYQWTSGSVDTGTPAGTTGSPWLVALGATQVEATTAMAAAINADGVAGTDYSTGLTANPDVIATRWTSSVLSVQSNFIGALGNSTVTTVLVGANLDWLSSTLTGGGSPSFTTVTVPDDVGAVSVAFIASYIIVVIAQGFGVNGRFYWINPGDTTIDPLNFATAERSPDGLINARAMGDQLWLFGTNSTEIWYPSGDFSAPFLRVQGRLFDRGVWGGTDVVIKDAIVVSDQDGVVYIVGPGGPQRVSTNAIEEKIRTAIAVSKTQL